LYQIIIYEILQTSKKENEVATNKDTNKKACKKVNKTVGIKLGAEARAFKAGVRRASKGLDPVGSTTYGAAKGSYQRSRANGLSTQYTAGYNA
jgi:hypothetical protein